MIKLNESNEVTPYSLTENEMTGGMNLNEIDLSNATNDN